MRVEPSVAKALIAALAAVIIAMVGGGGILANAFQGKANDKDRQIAVLTAQRDAWMNRAIEATLSTRRSRHLRSSGSEEFSSPERERMLDTIAVGAQLAIEVREEVKPDTFKAKPTFLDPRSRRQLKAPQKK